MFYRKYRPQTIAQLDNERIRETLGKALLENNWSHAYLFLGPRGTGKTSAARILAKIVNCTDRKKGEEPCNKCDSCKSITAGNNLDVIEIDGASNTGVDDIRDLREKVKLAPTGSKYKIYIIDEVHMLSTSAFNALLKTLEEPPEQVIFVLATTDPQKLPDTIVSRCLVYDFGRVGHDELVESLSRVVKGENLKVSKEILSGVADQAGGSFRDAHKLLEQLSMQSAMQDIACLDALKSSKAVGVGETLLKLMVLRKKKEGLEVIENFAKEDSDKLLDLINSLITSLRNILLSRNGILIEVNNLLISDAEINELIGGLIEAGVLMRDCPVVQLPLEMLVINFCASQKEQDESIKIEKPVSVSKDISPASPAKIDVKIDPKPVKESVIMQKWPEILAGVKPYNHSIEALLRATRPGDVKNGTLALEVFYKFHKEKLEEIKNRQILEKVASDIIGEDIKVKFVLSEGKRG